MPVTVTVIGVPMTPTAGSIAAAIVDPKAAAGDLPVVDHSDNRMPFPEILRRRKVPGERTLGIGGQRAQDPPLVGKLPRDIGDGFRTGGGRVRASPGEPVQCDRLPRSEAVRVEGKGRTHRPLRGTGPQLANGLRGIQRVGRRGHQRQQRQLGTRGVHRRRGVREAAVGGLAQGWLAPGLGQAIDEERAHIPEPCTLCAREY